MIYLIHGDNYFESGEELRSLVYEYNQKFSDAEVEVKHGDEANTLNDLFSGLDTISLFSTRKLLVVKRLFSNKKKSILSETADFLSERKKMTLVLWEEKSADKRSKLFKLISKIGVVREFEIRKPAALRSWFLDQAEKKKIEFKSGLADQIIFRVGENEAVLSNELDKLKLFLEAEGRKEITENDIENLVESREANIWEFIDSLVERNRKKALFQIEKLIRDKTDYIQTVGMIARELRMLALSDYKEKLGLHPFVLSKLKKHAGNFTKEKIKEMYKKLVGLDFSVKQGRIDEKLGLSLYVISV
ncbi:hypothetical protein JW796_02270 [Candidatus Dojkabacteria bacterium]|nr:hypothetical protein [Candidatus Dojkabacteria bacterium]